MAVKKVQKKKGAREGGSTKPNAIVLAGLKLFAQYGYRKTSMDDIANAAQVAKRTVYLQDVYKRQCSLLVSTLGSGRWCRLGGFEWAAS